LGETNLIRVDGDRFEHIETVGQVFHDAHVVVGRIKPRSVVVDVQNLDHETSQGKPGRISSCRCFNHQGENVGIQLFTIDLTAQVERSIDRVQVEQIGFIAFDDGVSDAAIKTFLNCYRWIDGNLLIDGYILFGIDQKMENETRKSRWG
jgi:hypothetical protein